MGSILKKKDFEDLRIIHQIDKKPRKEKTKRMNVIPEMKKEEKILKSYNEK